MSKRTASNPPMPTDAKRVYRQFDLKFKKKAVKRLKAARATGVWGLVKKTCEAMNVRSNRVYFWEQQLDSGILNKRNACAFSNNPSAMIRG